MTTTEGMPDVDYDEWQAAADEANADEQYDGTYASASRMLGSHPDIPVPEQSPDEPDANLLKKKPRRPKAMQFEKKALRVLNVATRAAISRPATVPDAAALLIHGPKLARAFGDLAADNDAIAKLIDTGAAVSDNSTLAAITALTGLATQIARNHEPVLEPQARTFRVPILKRAFKLPKIGVRVGLFRAVTDDPDLLTRYVLTNPDVVRALKEQGITLVHPDS